MIGEDKLKKLIRKTDSKIVMVVMDGVGDVSDDKGLTPLAEAFTPNMDKLALESELGLTVPVDIGITPGSGPAHLSLFGYDPLEHEIGRGVLEALGIGINLSGRDLAARANFATRTPQGIISDRRAGRISTEENERLCKILNEKMPVLDGVSVKIYPGKEHRFVVIFTGDGLEGGLNDADPQEVGKPEKFTEPETPSAEKSSRIVNQFIKEVQKILKDELPANTCLVRGIGKSPDISSMGDLFGLKPLAIASYPMYKGLSKLVGMDVSEGLSNLEEQTIELKKKFNDYDFFYYHVKKTDSFGEDGNRPMKIKVIEEFDALIPDILALKPDVLCISADHSTPAVMKGHSWHPSPVLIHGSYMRTGQVKGFNEEECLKGSLGRFYAKDLMQLLLSHAGKLDKYGA
ncbi:MAG: 2,3-bisphosphoglycerate-independent phosphoglycerate mutase [Elusimicrobia bacterium]|nr:2,3-bisphosphoglycerate-independent phosphoglycerate mutase [Elusimicrobiota bacterium]